jgi:hypothetical protein
MEFPEDIKLFRYDPKSLNYHDVRAIVGYQSVYTVVVNGLYESGFNARSPEHINNKLS